MFSLSSQTSTVHTCVEPEALAGPVPSGPSSSLAGRGLGDGSDHQGLQGVVWVVGPQLDERTVDDKDDPVDGDGGLGDVGGHHNLVRSNV